MNRIEETPVLQLHLTVPLRLRLTTVLLLLGALALGVVLWCREEPRGRSKVARPPSAAALRCRALGCGG